MKFQFNNDRIITMVQNGYDAPRGTWTRDTAALTEQPGYLLSGNEQKLVNKMRDKMLAAWYEIFELATANDEAHVIKYWWPSNEDEDFLVQAMNRETYQSRRYDVPEGRYGYGHNLRADGLRSVGLVSAKDKLDSIKNSLVEIIGTEPLKVELMPTTFPEGSTLVRVAYKEPEGQTRKPWMDAAVWPLDVVMPFNEAAMGLTKERGKVKVLPKTALSGLVPAGAAGINTDNMKNDLRLVLSNLPERVQAARNSYYADVRARMRANVTETNTIKVRTPAEVRKSMEAFGAHRKGHKEKLAATLKDKLAIEMLPFIGHGFASSRSWGIEIESGGARGIEAPKGWRRKGDGSLRSAWRGWVNDGSLGEIMLPGQEVFIRPDECPSGEDHTYELYDADRGYYLNPLRPNANGNPPCGRCDTYAMQEAGPAPIGHVFQEGSDDRAEFVSPILRSMHSNGLESLLSEVIRQPQNDTAGVHVHVEARDLTAKQLGSLVYGYDRIEGLIESSYRRTKRDYCKLRETSEQMNILKKSKSVSKLSEVPRGERYVTLNLQALDAHGTVEFRAMGNVYEYEYLVRWAMFCREMVNVAKAGVTPKEWNAIESWADVTALFAKYGKEYIRAVMDTMGEDVPSAPRLKRDASISMPDGTETTSEIAVSGSTFADLIATMDEGAINSRWITTVEQSIAGITSESSQRVLVGALASGETEV